MQASSMPKTRSSQKHCLSYFGSPVHCFKNTHTFNDTIYIFESQKEIWCELGSFLWWSLILYYGAVRHLKTV